MTDQLTLEIKDLLKDPIIQLAIREINCNREETTEESNENLVAEIKQLLQSPEVEMMHKKLKESDSEKGH